MAEKGIIRRIAEKRQELTNRLAELETERQQIKRELALLEELYPTTTDVSPTPVPQTTKPKNKMSLLEMAKTILKLQAGEELPSSKIADLAVERNLWVSPPDSFRASMSGTLGRTVKAGDCEWLRFREEAGTKFYRYEKKEANV